MPVTLTYYYTDGTSYYSDSAHTLPCAAPSTIYADFADYGKTNPNLIPLNWAVLSNGVYDIGFILDSTEPSPTWGPLWGGAVIGYLSRNGGVNFISAHDGGRELQPSYWASEAAGDPAYITTDTEQIPIYDEDMNLIGYRGNAVHYWNSAPGTGRVLSTSFADDAFTAVVRPGLWNGYVTASDVFTQTVSFDPTGEIIQIQYAYQYNGAHPRNGFWVNAPCIYAPATVLSNIAGYTGAAPWTGGALTVTPIAPDFAIRGLGFTEPWGALLDNSSYGVGLMSVPAQGLFNIPASMEAAAQGEDVVFDPEMGAAAGMTGVNQIAVNPDPYAATLAVSQMTPGSTYSFNAYVTVGAVADIRTRLQAFAPAVGSFTTPSVTLRPVISLPSLAGVQRGVFPTPSVTLQPAVAAPTLAGIQRGSFATPSVSLRPAVSAPAVTGVQQGSFAAPSVSLRPDVEPPTLQIAGVGISSGSFTLPALSLRPLVSPPSLLGMTGGSSIRAPSGQMLNLRRIDGSPLTILSI